MSLLMRLNCAIALCPFALLTGSQPGYLDTTFIQSNGSGYFYDVRDIAVRPDGHLLVVGGFMPNESFGKESLRQLTPTGKWDTRFDPGSYPDEPVEKIALQPDGKVIATGSFSIFDGTPCPGIVRLNLDGSIDSSFSPNVPSGYAVSSVLLEPSGSMIISVGPRFGGAGQRYLLRLDENGGIDPSFNSTPGTPEEHRAVARQRDGKLIVYGSFTSFRGIPRNGLARLHHDGSLDESFDPGLGHSGGGCRSFFSLPDDRLVIGGEFTSFDGESANRIIRLNSDGTVDPGFNPAAGPNRAVHAITSQPDGKLIIGGTFDTFAGVSRNCIARLMSDGKLDLSFHPGAGAKRDVSAGATHAHVFALVLQNDNRVVAGGQFEFFFGKAMKSLARLHLGFTHISQTFTGSSRSEDPFDQSLCGRVRATTTKSGQFTCSVTLGTETLRILGAFDANGKSRITVRRRDKSVIYADLSLTSGQGSTPVLTGELSDFQFRRSYIEAHTAIFTTRKLSTIGGYAHLPGSYHLPLDAGSHPGNSPLSGAGYLKCKLSNTGVMTMAGRSPDGSAISGSANLNQSLQLLLHFPLYKGSGMISGVADVDATGVHTPNQLIAGSLLWTRMPGQMTEPGFSQWLAVGAEEFFPSPSSQPPLGGITTNRVTVTIEGGHVAQVVSEVHFGLNGHGEVASGNVGNLKISIRRSASTFSGSFLPIGALKAVPFYGLITSRTRGYGYALVNIGGSTLPTRVLLDVVVP